jgi:hypothetical protein
VAFITSRGGKWWAKTANPKDPAELEDLTCIIYLHPNEKRLLIQWLYDGYKPYTEPAYFYNTDLRPLRRDLARGFRAICRGPQGEFTVDRHLNYEGMRDIAFGRSVRSPDP